MLKKLKKIAAYVLDLRFVRKIRRAWNTFILGIAKSSRLTSIIYHFISFFPFSREQHAYISGKYRYYKELNSDQRNRAYLRRNTHRLEKALVMEPRRDLFARDYIEETVDFYERAVAQFKSDPSSIDTYELDWAHDVLSAYFQTVKPDRKVAAQKERFESIDYTSQSQEGSDKVPFDRSSSPATDISYEQMLILANRRRSVRWFKQKKVPRELIDKAMMVARQAPSACNRQPFEFRFYDDPKLVKKIAGIPFGTGGYSHNIPVIAVIVGKLNYYFSSRDRHVIYVDSSLAAMSFMFAAETLGLSTSPINWPDFEPLEAKMQKTLGLKTYERPIMLMAVGYGKDDGRVPFSQKKSLDGLRSFNNIGK